MSLRFLGASVRGMQCGLGWGRTAGTMTVELIEDTRYGDLFTLQSLPEGGSGSPVYFTYGAFTFGGLVQGWRRRGSVEGLPLYEVTVNDPRELLENCKLILGGYNGATNVVPNLLNCYGYWENNLGFGGSLSSQNSMPWNMVKDAVHSLTASPVFTTYGGPISDMGVSYVVDLSQIPVAPIYYRIAGPSIDLMTAVSQVCEDAGCEFFVELLPTTPFPTIRVRTVPRFTQPPLGTLSTFILSQVGTVSNFETGIERRNDITSAFVVGGDVDTLYTTTTVQTFWGFDTLGNPILGTGTGDAHNADLNASPVAEILGRYVYNANAFELRCALDSIGSWTTYMKNFKPVDAAILGITPDMKVPAALAGIPQAGAVDVNNNAGADHFGALAAGLNSDTELRIQTFYQFVQSYAQDYMGKKFAVSVPFVVRRVDPETFQIQYSLEPTDSAYLPEGSSPLGLYSLNEDVFTTQEGKFSTFVKFTSLSTMDFTKVPAGDTILQDNGLFMKVGLDPQIILTPSPAVVITLGTQIWNKPTHPLGDLTAIAALLGVVPGDIDAAWKVQVAGVFAGKVHPAPIQPEFVAIALKSNILTYGPWYAVGRDGNTHFEQDPTLVPWNYGGFDVMNLAGSAKVAQAITNTKTIEFGGCEIGAAPIASLGDVLQANGPNVTNIQISYGREITTRYNCSTYTQRFLNAGGSRQLLDRVKRISLELQKAHRLVRTAIRNRFVNNAVLGQTFKRWNDNGRKLLENRSPHQIFAAQLLDFDTTQRVVGSTMEDTFVPNALQVTDTGVYYRVAATELTGLFRPFRTGFARPGDLLSALTEPSGVFRHNGAITSSGYNPFVSGNDVNLYTFSNAGHIHQYSASGEDYQEGRMLALRAPIILSGWGKDLLSGGQTPGSTYLRKSKTWKTGPADFLFDPMRGVWTMHDLLMGKLTGTLAPSGGTATMDIIDRYGGVYTGYRVTVKNQFSATVASGTWITAGYMMTANAWYITAADCLATGNGGVTIG